MTEFCPFPRLPSNFLSAPPRDSCPWSPRQKNCARLSQPSPAPDVCLASLRTRGPPVSHVCPCPDASADFGSALTICGWRRLITLLFTVGSECCSPFSSGTSVEVLSAAPRQRGRSRFGPAVVRSLLASVQAAGCQTLCVPECLTILFCCHQNEAGHRLPLPRGFSVPDGGAPATSEVMTWLTATVTAVLPRPLSGPLSFLSRSSEGFDMTPDAL